jgi:hypothetical protein
MMIKTVHVYVLMSKAYAFTSHGVYMEENRKKKRVIPNP